MLDDGDLQSVAADRLVNLVLNRFDSPWDGRIAHVALFDYYITAAIAANLMVVP